MKELLFASQNKHKLKEIQTILGPRFIIRSLQEAGFMEDLTENGSTLEENASQKARFIYSCLHSTCFAEDSGLEIQSLNGIPGVHSARFAGPGKGTADNILKVLELMKHTEDRRARFRTVICLIAGGQSCFVSGECQGTLLHEPRGSIGFGYDPIFVPEGFNQSFAELGAVIKNEISHRRKAVDNLRTLLEKLENL